MTRPPKTNVALDALSFADLARADHILGRLKAYSMAVDGVPKIRNAARHFLLDLPPDTLASAKHSFEVLHEGEPIGLVDLVQGYPRPDVTFIGLLAIAEDSHHRGFGRATFEAVEELARDKFEAKTLRLAVVASNDVEGFWAKMGFRRTGEVKPYEGEAVTSVAILMEKDLSEVPADAR